MEKGYNSGVSVERYLRYVHLSKGNPWCAAFVCWALGEARVSNPRSGWSPALFGSSHIIWDREQRTKNKEQRFPPTVATYGIAFSTSMWKSSRCACPPLAGVGGGFCIHKYPVPATGDVFGLYFKEKGRIAHVGFIDQWDGTWMISVEGNTNKAGSREGDGVYRKRRLVKSVYQVARYINH